MYMYNACIRRLSVMLLNQNKFWKKHFFCLLILYMIRYAIQCTYAPLINVTMVNQSRRRQTALFSILKEIAGLNFNC